MLFFNGFVTLLLAALWLYCLIDAITTPETAVRSLPKIAWVFIILLLFVFGAIGWLVFGRPWSAEAARQRLPLRDPGAGAAAGGGGGVGRGMSTRAARRVAATNPDDDEEFLAGLRARVEEQRRRAEEERRRRESGTDAD